MLEVAGCINQPADYSDEGAGSTDGNDLRVGKEARRDSKAGNDSPVVSCFFLDDWSALPADHGKVPFRLCRVTLRAVYWTTTGRLYPRTMDRSHLGCAE